MTKKMINKFIKMSVLSIVEQIIPKIPKINK